MNMKGKGKVKHCFFGPCKSDTRYGSPVTFIPFPKACFAVKKKNVLPDERHISVCPFCEKCNRWIQLCQRSDKNVLSVNTDTYICTKHFVDERGPSKLYPNPMETDRARKIRLSERYKMDSISDRLIEDSSFAKKDQLSNVFTLGTTPLTRNNLLILVGPAVLQGNIMNTVSKLPQTVIQEVKMEVDDEGLSSTIEIKEEQDEIIMCPESVPHKSESLNNPPVLQKKTRTTYTQTTFLFKDMLQLKEGNNTLKMENTRLRRRIKELDNMICKKKVERQRVTEFVESLRKNDKKCKFYTNLTFDQISILFNFLQPVDNLQYGKSKGSVKRERSKILTHFEELVIMLIRLRTGLLLQDLSYRFNISVGFISRIITAWVLHCYNKFNIIRPNMFASREKIRENLPKMFKKLKNIRVIINCAEFTCEIPSNFKQNGNLKFKMLLGCTPNGAVSFVSELFEGSISDEELVNKSKVLDRLEPGDLMLAGVRLNIPPFVKGRDRLTANEEIEIKKIARQRVFVEHVVGRLKKFKLLDKILPLKMREILPQMIFVCACLLNFQKPILDKEEGDLVEEQSDLEDMGDSDLDKGESDLEDKEESDLDKGESDMEHKEERD